MASGKKGKKTKGKTLALTDFLSETTGSIPVQPIRKSTTNWADEVEDYDAYNAHKPVNVVLPTAPKASREYEDFSDKVPNDPPYIAYLSNLPYDVDEDEIASFFNGMRVASMRIPKDDRSADGPRCNKGYGYVEFDDRDSLLNALVLPDIMLKNRKMRIEVAANADNDRRRGRMDMGNRDRGGDRESFSGDWRSGPRAEVQQDEREQRRGGGFNRDRDERGGGGFTRDRDERGGGGAFTRENMRNGGGGGGGGFTRRDDDRPGGWRDARDQDRGQDRDRGFVRRDNFRDSDRTSSRFDDREERRGGGGGGFRRFDDRERDSGYSRRRDEPERDREAEPAPAEGGRARPRLVLTPRTKPMENAPAAKSEGASTTTSVPSASIFGDAKPVDTAKREKEIEEKLLKGRDHDALAREPSRERRAPQAAAQLPQKEAEVKDEALADDREDEGEQDDVDRSRYRGEESSRGEGREVVTAPPKKTYDDKRAATRNNDKSAERGDDKSRSEKPKIDKREKEMPKLAEPEPPNFAASNKFAFLQTDEDNSD